MIRQILIWKESDILEANKQILNAFVLHKVFGAGTLKEVKGNMIIISFEKHGDKKFIYPDAFDKYLTLDDPDLVKIINEDLSRKKAKIAAEKAVLKQKYEKEQLAKEAANLNKQKKKTIRDPKTKGKL